LLQDQGLVASRTELVQFFDFDNDMLAGRILVAADDGVCLDQAVSGAVFLVTDAPTAAGMEEVEVRRSRGAAHGGISLDRNGHEADA
jgi:hypothetical protein